MSILSLKQLNAYECITGDLLTVDACRKIFKDNETFSERKSNEAFKVLFTYSGLKKDHRRGLWALHNIKITPVTLMILANHKNTLMHKLSSTYVIENVCKYGFTNMMKFIYEFLIENELDWTDCICKYGVKEATDNNRQKLLEYIMELPIHNNCDH